METLPHHVLQTIADLMAKSPRALNYISWSERAAMIRLQTLLALRATCRALAAALTAPLVRRYASLIQRGVAVFADGAGGELNDYRHKIARLAASTRHLIATVALKTMARPPLNPFYFYSDFVLLGQARDELTLIADMTSVHRLFS